MLTCGKCHPDHATEVVDAFALRDHLSEVHGLDVTPVEAAREHATEPCPT